MAFDHIIKKRVEFSETDMAGIVHFSNFFRYMEAAEASFFRELGFPLIYRDENESRGWPRVRANASFQQPLYFGDEIKVHLFVKALKFKAIEFFFRIYKIEGNQEIPVAKGSFTTVYVRRGTDSMEMQSIELPKDLLEKLEESPPECLNLRSDDSTDH
jgi:acyl-CoA thioester hydrolase